MSPTKRFTGRYQTTGEDGQSYEVLEYTTFVESGTLSSQSEEEEEGMQEYRTTDGSPVNRLSSTEFLLVNWNMKLKIID
jgi:hypothetical protein